MARNSNLNALDPLFAHGTEIQLTNTMYEKMTGSTLPKRNYYLKNNSALARYADEKGYLITEVQDIPIIERIVILKRKG